jgi:hypothetical protein
VKQWVSGFFVVVVVVSSFDFICVRKKGGNAMYPELYLI